MSARAGRKNVPDSLVRQSTHRKYSSRHTRFRLSLTTMRTALPVGCKMATAPLISRAIILSMTDRSVRLARDPFPRSDVGALAQIAPAGLIVFSLSLRQARSSHSLLDRFYSPCVNTAQYYSKTETGSTGTFGFPTYSNYIY